MVSSDEKAKVDTRKARGMKLNQREHGNKLITIEYYVLHVYRSTVCGLLFGLSDTHTLDLITHGVI